jgi:hypothetical protein
MWSETVLLVLALAIATALVGCAGGSTKPDRGAIEFFDRCGKRVLSFVGFSGSGYQDQAAMLASAREVLADHDPNRTIVNIGATPSGIGAVYEVARELGFETAGIVSIRARLEGVELSEFVDHVFVVEDETWGGMLVGTDQLSPTSETMVACSDVVVAIGGGDVARDELLAATARGKATAFVPAEMDHEIALEKARRKGVSEPTDFRGSAHIAWQARENRNSSEPTSNTSIRP